LLDGTFYGVHSGLAMDRFTCVVGRAEEEVAAQMARLEKIGSFGLTEPLVGSGASGVS